jgi:hypothetical protein
MPSPANRSGVKNGLSPVTVDLDQRIAKGQFCVYAAKSQVKGPLWTR